MSRLGLIVSIFMAMIKDVVQFVVIYAILVLAFSMLFLGVGEGSEMTSATSEIKQARDDEHERDKAPL